MIEAAKLRCLISEMNMIEVMHDNDEMEMVTITTSGL